MVYYSMVLGAETLGCQGVYHYKIEIFPTGICIAYLESAKLDRALDKCPDQGCVWNETSMVCFLQWLGHLDRMTMMESFVQLHGYLKASLHMRQG